MSHATPMLPRLSLGPLRNPVRGVLHGTAAVVTLAIASDFATRPGLPGPERAVWALWPLCHAALFAVSALYHSAPWGPLAKARMQRLDHSMIYVKIAGTVTAVSWLTLEPGWMRDGSVLIAWAIAAAGTFQKLWLTEVDERASRPAQVLQACLALPGLMAFGECHPEAAVGLLWAGAGFYAVGATCFLLEKPLLWPRVFSFHELFHVTTVVASGLHLSVALQVLASA
jgi:hemolysin III